MLNPDDLALFGRFPGHDLALDDCEALLLTRWQAKERLREPKLMGEKWWDYRGLHPVHATYLFAHLLNTKMREIIRAYINDSPPSTAENGVVRDWEIIKAGNVFTPPSNPDRHAYWQRKILGLIRARQAADADGIPYDLFVSEGLKHFYFGQGTYVLARSERKMPEPNMLYGDAVLLRIRAAWLEQIQIKVQHAQHPRYRAENTDAHPDHLKHKEWLTQQLALRPVKEHAAARLVREGFLRLDEALPRVDRPGELRRLLGAVAAPLHVSHA